MKLTCPSCSSKVIERSLGIKDCDQCTSKVMVTKDGSRFKVQEFHSKVSSPKLTSYSVPHFPTKRLTPTGQDEKLKCVCCKGPLPPLAQTGSMFEGLKFLARKTVGETPIVLVEDHDSFFIVSGGEHYEVVKRIPLISRKKGSFCHSCSAITTQVRNELSGEMEPIIKLDRNLSTEKFFACIPVRNDPRDFETLADRERRSRDYRGHKEDLRRAFNASKLYRRQSF